MGTLIQDLRYGLRMLAKNSGFTAVVVLTLSLGIGANTAIFSLIDEVMLKTLSVNSPGELVLIARGQPGGSFTYPGFEQFLAHQQVFAGIFGFAYRQVDVNIGGHADKAVVQLASGQYFSTLGLNAVCGRNLAPSDDRIGMQPVAVITYGYWKQRFGLDCSVLGKTLTINSLPFSIVGVAPPGFSGISLDYSVDVWVPMTMQPQLESGKSLLDSTGVNWVMVMGRVKPGVSEEQARSNLNLIFQQYLHSMEAPTSAFEQRVELFRGGQPVSGIRQFVSRPLSVMMVIVALVQLIACANVAILMLARSSARQKEFTVRAALGAGRTRLVRQLLTESILLAILGGFLGILLARWGNGALVALTFRGLTFLPGTPSIAFHPDIRVLGFTLTASVLAGILFGLAPALRATRIDLVSGLKENVATVGGSGHRLRLDKSLLVFQVAASLLLLIVAGLFVRSFQKLGNVELGFDSKNLVQLQFLRFSSSYSREKLSHVWSEMLDRIKATPGVVSASMSVPGLFGRANYFTDITVEGDPARPRHGERDLDHEIFVSPGFFTAMGQPLVSGRDISPKDDEHGPKVAVINETLSRAYFRSANPIGKRIFVGGRLTEIVGVAGDTKYDSVLAETPTIVYLPLRQYAFASSNRVFEVRTATNATAAIPDLRRAVQSVDPDLPMDYAGPLTDLVGQSLTLQRLSARLTGFFGLLGLLLASIGLYGLMSYVVIRRTKEIGVRMALGAEHSGVLWLVMHQALLLVLMGIGIGLGTALATTKIVSSQLFGLNTADPIAISVATLLMLVVAGLAGYIPARRAAKVDPMVALRYE